MSTRSMPRPARWDRKHAQDSAGHAIGFPVLNPGGNVHPGKGALYVSQTCNFKLPVKIGDTLKAECTVTGKLEKFRVKMQTTCTNQRGEVVVEVKPLPSLPAKLKTLSKSLEETVDFNLTSEQMMIRDMVREFAAKEVAPIAAEIDRDQRFPAETIEKMKGLGLMGISIPEEYGGAGGDTVSYALACEELARVSASTSAILSVHITGIKSILFLALKSRRKNTSPTWRRETSLPASVLRSRAPELMRRRSGAAACDKATRSF